jgi:hypothetical protein
LENVEPFAFWVGLRINRPNVFDEDKPGLKQLVKEEDENKVIHRDSNGVILEVFSSLIKDLK